MYRFVHGWQAIVEKIEEGHFVVGLEGITDHHWAREGCAGGE